MAKGGELIDRQLFAEAVQTLGAIDAERLNDGERQEIRRLFDRIPKEAAQKNFLHCFQEILLAEREGNREQQQRWFAALLSLRESVKPGNPERAYLESCITASNLLKLGADNAQLLLVLSILYNDWSDRKTTYALSVTKGIPSVLRGAKDLSEWGKNYRAVGSIVRPMISALLNNHGEGCIETATAELLYEKNEINEASLELAGATSAADPEIQFAALCLLAKIGRLDPTFKHPDEVLSYLGQQIEEKHAEWLWPNYQALCAEFAVSSGKIDRVSEWLESCGGSDLSRCCLNNSYVRRVQAKGFLAVGRYRDAAMQIENLLRMTEGDFRPLDRADYLLDGAIACELMGSREHAFSKIQEALEIAYPYGYIRIFADKGRQMFQLLAAYGKSCDLPEPMTRFLRAVTEAAKDFSLLNPALYAPVKKENAGAPELTRAETQILHMLDEGKSNKQIAEEMEIKLPTVKFHLRNLFEKLGASSRMEVVSAAKKWRIL